VLVIYNINEIIIRIFTACAGSTGFVGRFARANQLVVPSTLANRVSANMKPKSVTFEEREEYYNNNNNSNEEKNTHPNEEKNTHPNERKNITKTIAMTIQILLKLL
jgi:hypothetical protein